MQKRNGWIWVVILVCLTIIALGGINNPDHHGSKTKSDPINAAPLFKLPSEPPIGAKEWPVKDGVLICDYEGDEVETKSGDTLFKLVVKYTHVGTSSVDSYANNEEAVEAMADLNGIKDKNKIPTGVKLRVFEHCGY